MRFFAHDGKSTHGPAGIEELLKLPGFDGDTLVCPVGSNDTADWKPALAYPPFRKALLEAPVSVPAPLTLPPMPIIPPMPAPAPMITPPAPLPPVKTAACPRCAHANLEEAHFCNSCGARMDGRLEDIVRPPPAEPTPAPALDPFAHLDPMLSFPAESGPLPESPNRPLQPGKMGQLAELEESAPASPAPALAPAPVAEVVPISKRPIVLAAFAGTLVAAGLAYMMLNKSAPVETVAELAPTAPMPMPEPAPPAPPVYTPPPALSSLPQAIPAPKTPKAAVKAKAPKRARKPRPSREPRATQAQANPDGKDPLLEALLSDATQPAAESAAQPASSLAADAVEKAPPMIGQRPAAKPSQFSLPGLQRPVSASDRAPAPQARAPRPAAEEVAQMSNLDALTLAEPGQSPPPPGIENETVKSAEGDQLALVQVHEQFDFCAQLLAQGAYGDHYDTCLCKDAREAAPYRGRRGFYVTAKKKEAGGGRLETSAKILSSKINDGVAKVTARWKSDGADKGRDLTQAWKLEDGLWCQAP